MNIEEKIKSNSELPEKQKLILQLLTSGNMISTVINNGLKPFDISKEQFNVLRILRGQQSKTLYMNDINERMVTKMSNTTRLVDKLVDKRLVKRNVCPENRRKIELGITDLGLSQLAQMDLVVEKAQNDILKYFTESEITSLNKLLTKIE